jgi:hypothetical protein
MDRNPASTSTRGYTQPKFTRAFRLLASKLRYAKKTKSNKTKRASKTKLPTSISLLQTYFDLVQLQSLASLFT